MSTSPKPESADFSVRVTPRSSQNKIVVVDSSSLKAWVTAPPVDGEANSAVCELLARALSVSKSRVNLVFGTTGREKQIRVDGISAAEAIARLQTSKSA